MPVSTGIPGANGTAMCAQEGAWFINIHRSEKTTRPPSAPGEVVTQVTQ